MRRRFGGGGPGDGGAAAGGYRPLLTGDSDSDPASGWKARMSGRAGGPNQDRNLSLSLRLAGLRVSDIRLIVLRIIDFQAQIDLFTF